MTTRLSSPIVLAGQNVRDSVIIDPLRNMNLALGSHTLLQSTWADDFENYAGPIATGTSGGYTATIVGGGSSIGNDTTDILEGNGKVALVAGTGASDHAQLSTATGLTAMAQSKRMVAAWRVKVVSMDDAVISMALHEPGGDLFAANGGADSIQFVLQGLNAGNNAIVVRKKDNVAASDVLSTTLRDELFTAIERVMVFIIIVNVDNSVSVAYSINNGATWLSILEIPSTATNLPDEVTDILAMGIDVQAALGQTATASLDWMGFTKTISS